MKKSISLISHIVAPRKQTEDPSIKDGLFTVYTKDVDETLHANHTICEYLTKNAITKIYLDKDIYVELEQGQTAPHDHVVRQYENEVIEHVDELVEMLETDQVELTFVIATRHGPTSDSAKYKLSFRPFLSGCEIRYTDIPAIIQAAGQEKFWDMTVYKPSEQLLAAIHGIKGNTKGYFDARILQMKKGHGRDRTLDYLAQHTEHNWALLDLSKEFVKEQRDAADERKAKADSSDTAAAAATAAGADSTSTGANVKKDLDPDPEFVIGLLACLNAQSADDRTTWLKVAFGVKAAYGMQTDEVGAERGEDMDATEKIYFDAWIEFSKRATGKYKGIEDCRKTWESISLRGSIDGGIKIGTLCFYAARDNPVRYKELQLQKMKRRDTGDFRAEVGGREIQSRKQKKAGINRGALLAKLRGCSAKLKGLPDTTEITTDSQGTTISFDGGRDELRGTIEGKLGFTVHDADGTFMGTICDDVTVPGSLGFVHCSIPDMASFVYNRKSERQATLQADIPNLPLVTLNNMLQENAFLSMSGKVISNKTKVGPLQKNVMDAINTHVHKDFNIVQNILNNNGTINLNLNQNDTASAFPIIRAKLLEYACERKLMKRDGIVYEPVPDCPCAYREAFTYADYVNEVLQGDPIYTSNPKRFDEAIKYMTNYRDAEMPKYEPDRDLMSFANGVLELASGSFTEYAGMDGKAPIALRVARHHIHQQYTGSTDTPLLDKVLGAQFETEVAQLLCALFGRSLFRIGQLDGWQVMPYLVGLGGTGKSLLLNLLQHMFAPGAVGNLAAKREEVFGMANLVDKEIVMGRDMPAKLSGSLPQELMQAMTAGEGMEVPRKGQVALNVTWVAPVVLASNHMPDYINTGNNVGRRLVTLRFDHVVGMPQDDLQKTILETELPNIVSRCLFSYAALRERVKETGGFWKAVPPVILEWQSKLAAATNKLHEFLAMEDDERGLKIERMEGNVTWLLDFKSAFEARMGPGSFTADPATFHAFGYRVSDRLEHVCKSCKNIARARGGGCCDAYDSAQRTKKNVVYDMRVTSMRNLE
jgi:hypothetical protein